MKPIIAFSKKISREEPIKERCEVSGKTYIGNTPDLVKCTKEKGHQQKGDLIHYDKESTCSWFWEEEIPENQIANLERQWSAIIKGDYKWDEKWNWEERKCPLCDGKGSFLYPPKTQDKQKEENDKE